MGWYWTWKTWKVIEFDNYFIFQAWKVMIFIVHHAWKFWKIKVLKGRLITFQ